VDREHRGVHRILRGGGFAEKCQQWRIFLCSQFDKAINNLVYFATADVQKKNFQYFTTKDKEIVGPKELSWHPQLPSLSD
jgi:hypothetical protein